MLYETEKQWPERLLVGFGPKEIPRKQEKNETYKLNSALSVAGCAILLQAMWRQR